jgi:hypothetical protein
VAVVSDVHGMYRKLIRLLRSGGIIDERDRWSAGDTLLVVLGDSVGRGPDSVGVVDFLGSLSLQAPEASGRVVCLLGNHDARLLAGPGPDRPGSSKALLKELEAKGMSAEEFTDPRGPRGAFLRAMPAALRVGSWLFVHAGLLPRMEWKDFVSLSRRVLRGGDYGHGLLSGKDSILEARLWWKDPALRRELEERLSAAGLFGLVFGHEPEAFGVEGRPAISADGRLIKVDNGMASDEGNPGSLLVFSNPSGMNAMAPAEVHSVDASGRSGPVARERAGSVVLKVDANPIALKPFLRDFLARSVAAMVSSLKRGRGRRIELSVDARGARLGVDSNPVPLKPFVQDFLSRSVEGMVSSLQGGSRAREILLCVEVLEPSGPAPLSTRVSVDGEALPVNAFVQDISGRTVAAMASSLKGGGGREIELSVEASDPGKARLRVDGRPVPLNAMVRDMLTRAAAGMASSLKGGLGARSISFSVRAP